MGNPIFLKKIDHLECEMGDKMSVSGIMDKFVLFMCSTIFFAVVGYVGVFGYSLSFFIISAMSAFLVGLLIILKKSLAKYLTFVYSSLEGAFLGGFAKHYQTFDVSNKYTPLICISVTVAVAFTVFCLHKFKVVKVGDTFRNITMIATCSIAILYFTSFILKIMGVGSPVLQEDKSIPSILFSVFVCVVASMNFAHDLDIIESKEGSLDKSYEWYYSFGLLVTVVWLYIELLRLMHKAD